MAAGESWKAAFEAIRRDSDFTVLHELIEERRADGINEASIEWDGIFLSPLFVAVLLRLDDQLPQLIALGADPSAQCFFEGLLCCPLHAAALRGDAATLAALLDAGCDASLTAEASAVEGASPASESLMGCNALHIMVARDVFSEEVYRLLIQRGVRLSASCRDRSGAEIPGLLLPRRLRNSVATEEQLDRLLGEEVKQIIKCSRLAHDLNSFLEMGAMLRRDHKVTSYSFASDIDVRITETSTEPPILGQDEEPSTALLYAAEAGNCEAVRLLLYAGADASRTVQRVLPFGPGRSITLTAQAVHLAALRSDAVMVEQLLFFGADPGICCSGQVHVATAAAGQSAEGETEAETKNELWTGLTLVHLAVLNHSPEVISAMLTCGCSCDTPALRSEQGGPEQPVPPLLLAILLGIARCTTKLLDCGATISDTTREAALSSKAMCEMFGGPSAMGLQEWVTALLSGEDCLLDLILMRTDLSKCHNWPEEQGATARLLGGLPLATPELIRRLSVALEELPTTLRNLQPVHLACLLGQPWAVRMLVEAGAPLDGEPSCQEVLRNEAARLDLPQELAGLPLDLTLLCARLGDMEMLQFLSLDGRFGTDMRAEVELAPDLTPAFFPRHVDTASELGRTPTPSSLAKTDSPDWAWLRLGPLEMALLHRRTDVAVMLVKLGADLLHRVDHVAIRPPSHYSITDMCFRGLTCLHLCALLDMKATAAALLSEALGDREVIVRDEQRQRPRRKELLAAKCVQAWATLETGGRPEKEPWLWADVTPLHLAILAKNYDTAELLIEASTPETLSLLCVSKDLALDTEQSFSALLLAFEHNLKDLHRKIAKKFPTC